MWCYEKARQESKEELGKTRDSLMKLEVGTRYKYDDLVRKAYEELAVRPEPFSIDEARRVGLEAAMHISRLRELRCKSMGSAKNVDEHGRVGHLSCPYCSKPVFDAHTTPALYRNSVGGTTRAQACGTCRVVLYGESASGGDLISEILRVEIAKLLSPPFAAPFSTRAD